MSGMMADIPVNDIAPLVEIHDYTIYLFAGAITIGIVVTLSLVFFILKKWRNRRVSERHKAYKALESISMNDPKSAAYAISRIGYLFSHDNERTKQAYHNLFERLEPYKYAPVVDAIDEETQGYYHLYLEIIDV